MNYLAHLSLSYGDSAIMTGNFIADDIPRKEEVLVPEDIRKGIVLHRKIDEFTDSHDSFKLAVERLRPHHRKYAPVVIDILNDHVLSKTWDKYHDQNEVDFHEVAYAALEQEVERLPPKASLHVLTLLEHRYLRAYSSKEGLENILVRMDRRARFSSDFKSAADHLYEDYSFYEGLFVKLYEDLITMIERER